MKFATVIGFLPLLLLRGAICQLVSIGPKSESLKQYCEQVEPLRPHLVLRESTQITGRITDQTTEPFRKTRIELRRFVSATKQVVVKKLTSDGEGNFDLGLVSPGKYRLLLSESRAFKQPETLTCGEKKCALEAVLVANSTDQLDAPCPIR